MKTVAPVTLTDDEMRAVRRLVSSTDQAQLLRRALAILWLGKGESAKQVADRLCVSRATVYNWAARFRERAGCVIADRVDDAPRSGRPRARVEEDSSPGMRV
jgi:transposase